MRRQATSAMGKCSEFIRLHDSAGRPTFLNIERSSAMAALIKNWNEDIPSSEMDIFDLKTSLELGHSVATVADFLMRREDEVRAKAIELGLLSPDHNGQR